MASGRAISEARGLVESIRARERLRVKLLRASDLLREIVGDPGLSEAGIDSPLLSEAGSHLCELFFRLEQEAREVEERLAADGGEAQA